MGAKREELALMMGAAIEKYSLGLEITGYDITFSWGPNPQTGALMPAYWLFMTARSPLLGAQPMLHMAALGVGSEQEHVDQVVMNGLSELREQKAKILNGSQPNA